MTSQDHHEFGPSVLENLDPESDGCRALVRDHSTNPEAEGGTRKHAALVTEDLSVLEGDSEAEREVLETAQFFAKQTRGYTGENFRERMLSAEGVNFGTLDALHFNASGTAAYVGDAKFGYWSVTDAEDNLQGINYALLVFLNFPKVRRIDVEFYMAKLKRSTRATFYRKSVPQMLARIQTVIENARRAKENPTREDFTPNPVICGFCHRINCPARVELASSLVTAWSGKPVQLPTLNLVKLSVDDLAALKRLTNALKVFVKAVDEEARRRVFDCDEILPGYELREKSGVRALIGAQTISRAMQILRQAWRERFPELEFPLGGNDAARRGTFGGRRRESGRQSGAARAGRQSSGICRASPG